MHADVVAVIVAILLMAGIPKSSIVVRWRRKDSDLIVPGLAAMCVVVLDFYG